MSIFLLIITALWPQFVEVNAELDMRRLGERDRQLFESLSKNIEDYYLNTQFLADASDINIAIRATTPARHLSRWVPGFFV